MTKIASSTAHLTKPPKAAPIPPLRNGDRLTVKEFERRYHAMPHVKKAELIEGVVFMPSPVSFERHGEPDNSLSGIAAVYKAHTPGVTGASNATLRILVGVSEVQPDACLRIRENVGGSSWIDEDRFLTGSPDWLGEVAASSTPVDLGKKLPIYEKNGVREYVVWRVDDKEIDWFILKRGKYQRLAMTKAGLYKSRALPGLWLDATAMIAGELLKVLEVLQKGIESPEHRRFVAKLRSKKK
jgi:hypothetical protein